VSFLLAKKIRKLINLFSNYLFYFVYFLKTIVITNQKLYICINIFLNWNAKNPSFLVQNEIKLSNN